MIRKSFSWWRDFHYWLKFNLGYSRLFYYIIYANKNPYKRMAVSRESNICIEGYPRSSNSYAVVAFHLANENVRIAHHHHVLAQIYKSMDYHIPIITVIRKPEDAITSFLIFQRSFNVDLYIKTYTQYYKRIISLHDQMIIADFDTVVNNFNKVINAVNVKYNSNYRIINNLEYRQNEIFGKLSEVNKIYFRGDKNKLMFPDDEREKLKHALKEHVMKNKYLNFANTIYKKILEYAV